MSDRRAAGLVFAAALAVRLLALCLGQAEVLRPEHLGNDSAEYQQYARSLLDDGVYQEGRGYKASRVPGYPWFLALSYFVLGSSPWAAGIAQAILGAASCLLIFLTARKWMTPGWALSCGLFASVFQGLVRPGLYLLSEPLAIFFVSLFLFLLLRDDRSWLRHGALLGLAAGCAYLTRTELGPAAAIAAAVRLDRRRLAAFAVALFLTVSPWIIRNYLLFDRFMPGTSASAASLYIGVYGTLHDSLGIDLPGVQFQMADPKTPEKDLLEVYGRKTKDFYENVPWPLFLRALTYNTVILFYPFLPGYDATFVFLIPFLLFSILLWRTTLPVLALFFVMAAEYLLAGQTVSRFRQNLSPMILLLGFLGLQSLWTRHKTAVAGWAAFNAAGLLWGPQLREGALALKRLLWRA